MPIKIGIGILLLGLIGFGTYKAVVKEDNNDTNDSTEVALNTDTIPQKNNEAAEKARKDSIDAAQNAADLAKREQFVKDSMAEVAKKMSEAEKIKSFNEAKQKGDVLFAQKQYQAAKQAYQTALQLNPKDAYCKGKIQACDVAIAESKNVPTQQPNYNPPPRPARTYGTINGLRDATGEVFDYEGDIVSGTPNGTGTFKYKNGNICKGKVYNGRLNGLCECNYTDGAKFVGSAVNDVCTGPGVYYFPGGGRYEGNFANDNFNGVGRIYHQNGKEWFEGNFVNGDPVGTVVWHNADGSTQKGHIEKGAFIPDEGGKTKSQQSGGVKTHHKL